MPLQEIWNRNLCFPERKRTRFRPPWFDREVRRHGFATNAASDCALCSARSTVAIRSSIRVPVNFISNIPAFLLRTRPCSVFFLAAPGKLHHRVCFQNLYPARLTITAPGARQFLRTNSNLPANAGAKLFRRRASWRCATADCDQSLLRSPSPASWSAAGTSPASHPREAHP